MEALKNSIAKNWKTTSASILTAFFLFVASNPNKFGGNDSWLVSVAQFAQYGGLMAFGITAKDYNKSGGKDDTSQ